MYEFIHEKLHMFMSGRAELVFADERNETGNI